MAFLRRQRKAEQASDRKRAGYMAIAVAWSLGWRIAAGVLIGSWLDGYFDTSPLFILIVGLGALVAAVRMLIAIGTEGPASR